MSALLAPPQRVLVRLPSWLGDVVMAEPVLRALDERYRERGAQERLSFSGPARLLTLFAERFGGVRRIATDASEGESPAAWRGHDVALLLNGSFRSVWCAMRAEIRVRAGWRRNARGWLLTHGATPALERGGVPLGLGRAGRRPRYLPRPFGATCVELAAMLGLCVRDTRPRLEVTQTARDALAARLAKFGHAPGEPFVLANVGARRDSAKAYPPESWIRVLEELHRRTALPIVLVFGRGEEEVAARVRHGVARTRIAAWTEPVANLPELAAASAAASVVLTADTGPRHVANAVGAKLVVVAGPTDPRHTADHLERTRLVRVVVPCGPCHLERCPLEGERHHACMRSVDPLALAAAAEELLAH